MKEVYYMLTTTLTALGIAPTAQQVYTALLAHGSASARQLADRLALPRPTVYDALKALITHGLVVERDEDHKKVFQVDDVEQLPARLQTEIERLTQEEAALTAALPTLKSQLTAPEPRIRFYPGVIGIRQVLKDMLWQENIETLTMWPIRDMIPILGEDYLADLNRRRIRRKISIRGVWPADKVVDLAQYPFLGTGPGHLRTMRLAPQGMSWQMSYWKYGDSVAFISSAHESFGLVVRSADFAQLITTQFEALWQISKPYHPPLPSPDPFLKTV